MSARIAESAHASASCCGPDDPVLRPVEGRRRRLRTPGSTAAESDRPRFAQAIDPSIAGSLSPSRPAATCTVPCRSAPDRPAVPRAHRRLQATLRPRSGPMPCARPRRTARVAGSRSPAETCRAASPRAEPVGHAGPRRGPARPRARLRRRPRPRRRRPTRPRRRPRPGPGSSRRPPCAASSPSDPRAICSCSFVSSRQTAPGRSAPQAAARSRSVAASRPGASNRTVPRSSAAIRASRSRRSRPERGRNPSNDQRGPRHAARRRPPRARTRRPGSGTTVPPAAAHAATSPSPGSDTTGVPASVTSARSAPPSRCARSSRSRAGPLRAW